MAQPLFNDLARVRVGREGFAEAFGSQLPPSDLCLASRISYVLSPISYVAFRAYLRFSYLVPPVSYLLAPLLSCVSCSLVSPVPCLVRVKCLRLVSRVSRLLSYIYISCLVCRIS